MPLETTAVVPRLLTGRQVLDLLDCRVKYPRQRLLDLRNAGLPGVYLRGKFVYRAEDVLEFIQSHGSARAS